MGYNHRFFKYALAILLVLLIIFMLGQINFFLSPLQSLLVTILAPIVAGGLFYYFLRPLIALLQRFKIPKVAAILITFVVVLIILGALSTYTGKIIVQQFIQLSNELPKSFLLLWQKISELTNQQWFGYVYNADVQQRAASYLEGFTRNLTGLFFGFLGTLTNIDTVLLLVPFMLFYFLKDDYRISGGLVKLVPRKHRKNAKEIIQDVDAVVASYIQGQMLVAVAIGVMMYIGYLIIGMKFAFILAFFAMLTCIIPFFGPWIGIIPALLISLTIDPFMALKVLIVMQVVQQIDNNFISPQVMQRNLDIHPVTVILLLMGSVSLFGFFGLLFAIPVYAAVKATVKNIYEMYFADKAE
jgi:predicted PurR-regulated permease PerM